MSIEQIERQIQQLPASELVRLCEWFNGFLASHTHPSTTAEPDWQETPKLMAELSRRLAEFQANPDMAVPFEPEHFESVKRQLADERAQKASAR